MKPSILFRKWHKWLALVVGVQLLFWTLSGFFMSAVPIENIRSEHLQKSPALQVLSQGKPYVTMDSVLGLFDGSQSVISIKLRSLLSDPVYHVETSDGKIHLVDALKGTVVSPLGEEKARAIAKAHFNGSTDKMSATLVGDPVLEYKGDYPVWRLDFHNLESTSFYVSPDSGEVTAKRGLLWRVYDFLWMLHIMDYQNRSDFNNWLLIFMAALGLSLSVSGLALIRYTFRKRDFQFFNKKKKGKGREKPTSPNT